MAESSNNLPSTSSSKTDKFGNCEKIRDDSDYQRNQYYMQLSDSDDDDKSEIHPPIRLTSAPLNRGKQQAAPVKRNIVVFKHDKPVMRERPLSAKLFHALAKDDPESKVLCRFGQ